MGRPGPGNTTLVNGFKADKDQQSGQSWFRDQFRQGDQRQQNEGQYKPGEDGRSARSSPAPHAYRSPGKGPGYGQALKNIAQDIGRANAGEILVGLAVAAIGIGVILGDPGRRATDSTVNEKAGTMRPHNWLKSGRAGDGSPRTISANSPASTTSIPAPQTTTVARTRAIIRENLRARVLLNNMMTMIVANPSKVDCRWRSY